MQPLHPSSFPWSPDTQFLSGARDYSLSPFFSTPRQHLRGKHHVVLVCFCSLEGCLLSLVLVARVAACIELAHVARVELVPEAVCGAHCRPTLCIAATACSTYVKVHAHSNLMNFVNVGGIQTKDAQNRRIDERGQAGKRQIEQKGQRSSMTPHVRSSQGHGTQARTLQGLDGIQVSRDEHMFVHSAKWIVSSS